MKNKLLPASVIFLIISYLGVVGAYWAIFMSQQAALFLLDVIHATHIPK
jgi:hypothetical protein